MGQSICDYDRGRFRYIEHSAILVFYKIKMTINICDIWCTSLNAEDDLVGEDVNWTNWHTGVHQIRKYYVGVL